MRQRRVRQFCSALLALALSGCAGTSKPRAPSLNEADAIRIANKFVVDAGLQLSPQQAAAVRASYDPQNGLWCFFYSLYTDRLPAGPIVCVSDKSSVAAFAPSM